MIRTLGLFLLLVISVLPGTAQLTDPWQSDWNVFAQQVAPEFLSLQPPTASGNFVTFQQYSNREFEWQGEFGLISSGLVAMSMPNVGINFAGNVPGLLFAVIASPSDLSQWTGFRQGRTVRFRGRIEALQNIGMLQTSGVNTAFVVANSLTPVTGTSPPTAVLSISAQAQTVGNNGTLNLTAPAGQPVAVNFSASASTAGSGTIAAYEWRNNGNVISTQASFTANLSAATNDISLKITNTSGQTATATARVNIQASQSQGPTLVSENPVVHGASFQRGLSSATWLSIRGANFTTVSRVWEGRDFNGNNLPTALDGISVRINGRNAYIYYISPTQLNILSPDDTLVGPVDIEVITPGGTVRTTANLQSYAPGFFTFSPWAACIRPRSIPMAPTSAPRIYSAARWWHGR